MMSCRRIGIVIPAKVKLRNERIKFTNGFVEEKNIFLRTKKILCGTI
jgi:hypothetical protein